MKTSAPAIASRMVFSKRDVFFDDDLIDDHLREDREEQLQKT